ncbi:MAG: phosphoenolpyruvate--protein phosphotransferase [Candidatus Kapaibacteriota bacterium]
MNKAPEHIPNTHIPEQSFHGIPASRGIVFGKAIVIYNDLIGDYHEHISHSQIPAELERFAQAVLKSEQQFNHVISISREQFPAMSHILETYSMILMDSDMHESIRKKIKEGFSAENAIFHNFNAQKQFFLLAKDPILSERAVDFDHVSSQLLSALRNKTISHQVCEDSIVIATSITPTDIMTFKQEDCRGFATEIGGIASHASILARSLSMTSVIGIHDIVHKVRTGDAIILDGNDGILIVHPTEETQQYYRQRSNDEREYRASLGDLIHHESMTKKGTHITISANIDSLTDIDEAIANGAQGIGLLRSEFQIARYGRIPDEETQFEWYATCAKKVYPEYCTIRAFDIGSDKFAEGLPKEENPALGVRGIRFLLKRKDIFKTQLRAIIKASKTKNVKLMLPMITNVSEVLQTLELLEECKAELNAEGYLYDPHLPFGIMIETPASALDIASYLPYCDFFSIGTNDLTQYLLAADRINEHVAEIYDIFHPIVFRLIENLVATCSQAGKDISLCGELAGFTDATDTLLSLGLKHISISPPLIPGIKRTVIDNESV